MARRVIYRREIIVLPKEKKLAVAIIVLVFAVVSALSAFIAVKDHRDRNTYVSFYDFWTNLEKSETTIVMRDVYIPAATPPGRIGGTFYFPVDFVREYIDKYIFWEPQSGRLTVTTGEKSFKFHVGSAEYTVNSVEGQALGAPVMEIGGMAYVPEEFLELFYDYTTSHSPGDGYDIVALDYLKTGSTLKHAEALAGGVKLRYKANPKAPIAKAISPGETFIILEENAETGYSKVRTIDGLVGYVLSKEITVTSETALEKAPEETPYLPKVAEKGKIIMAWQYFDGSSRDADKSAWNAAKGLDVVSPTWFSFSDKLDGTVTSIAQAEYTGWAHSQGLQVWGLVTDNFSYSTSRAILTVTESRERAAMQLVALAAEYGLDGINIDFEMVRKDDIDYYIQFLRELYPLLRERGMVLSVDMKPPQEWSLYYNRAEVAKTSDFIVVMAYDEHWSTSPVAGPNASLGFVESAIAETLKEVPAEKLILGVPFYTRVWCEKPDAAGNPVISSASYSMDRAFRIFADRNCSFTWDAEAGSYYTEYYVKENGVDVKYFTWLEDEVSMQEKLRLAALHNVAGISGWRAGLEREIIWDMLFEYFKTSDY